MPNDDPRLDELRERREQSLLGGGPAAIERQHERGKLTARERIDLLVDPGTFEELDAFKIHRCRDFGMEREDRPGRRRRHGLRPHRRPRRSASSRRTSPSSAARLSGAHAEKICKLMDLAMKIGVPGHRPQRLGRRAHPGGRRLARRLRRHLPAQHAGLRRRPADLGGHGPVRRRRGLLARDHRLHLHGRGHVATCS